MHQNNIMRTKALSIFCDSQLKSHEEWLMSRLEGALELDPNESKYYARWVISVMTGSPDEIEPRLEEELFVYNRSSPNANHADMELMFDKRSPEEIVMNELAAISSVENANSAVLKIITRLRRRLDSKRRQRINSYVSETSSSSSSTLSTYEDEFPTLTYMPKMDSREMTEEKIDEMMSESNGPPRSSGDGNNNFRFAFKNPRSKRQQQRQEQRAKKNQTALQHSQAGRVKSQSPTKKPKNPESKQPQNAQPKAQEKLDEQSTPTKKRRRRNRRKKKSITESDKPTEDGEAVKQIAKNANFDRLSIDEALEFVKNLSGQSEDQELWKNVVQNQHVKYTNGTFFFAPRLDIPDEEDNMSHMTSSLNPESFSHGYSRPTNSWSNRFTNREDQESEEEQKCLAQAASVAARSAEMIFDDLEPFETGSSYEIIPPISSLEMCSQQSKDKKESTWAHPESFIPMKTADWMSIW